MGVEGDDIGKEKEAAGCVGYVCCVSRQRVPGAGPLLNLHWELYPIQVVGIKAKRVGLNSQDVLYSIINRFFLGDKCFFG